MFSNFDLVVPAFYVFVLWKSVYFSIEINIYICSFIGISLFLHASSFVSINSLEVKCARYRNTHNIEPGDGVD